MLIGTEWILSNNLPNPTINHLSIFPDPYNEHMPCSVEFIDFICYALEPLGEVESRKMMGEYIVRLNGKCVVTACDNIAYIKKLPCVAEMMTDAESGYPYKGAKEAYILDFSDAVKARKVISVLWEYLDFPKAKKKTKRRE